MLQLAWSTPRAPDGVDVEDAVAIDAAFKKLQTIDPGQAETVELRFFGGVTVEETAEVLSMWPRTIKREWALPRAWLHRELGPGQAGEH